MSFRRCASLVLVLAVSACASSGGMASGEGGQTAERAPRGNATLIIRAELDELGGGRNLWEAVDLLRPRWLRRQRGAGSIFAGPTYARVVVDGTARGELDDLRRFFSDNIETLRYLSPADATTKYGTGFPGGVIEVSTRGLGR